MNRLAIADDGSIHNVNSPSSIITALPPPTANNEYNVANDGTIHSSYSHPVKADESEEGAGVFWVISIIMSLIISIVFYNAAGPEIFGKVNESSDLFFNAVAQVGPIVMVIGGLVGTILFGKLYTKDHGYGIDSYIISAISALGGVIAGIILSFIIMILLVIAIIIGFIAAIISGLS